VAAGLAAAHPELTVEAVLDLDASLTELNTAVAAILQSAGLSPVGEADPRVTPGEMARLATIAEPIPAPGSAASPAPSPPACAPATTRGPAPAKQDHTTTSNDGAAEDPRDAFAAGRWRASLGAGARGGRSSAAFIAIWCCRHCCSRSHLTKQDATQNARTL